MKKACFFTNKRNFFFSTNMCLKCFGFLGKPRKNKKNTGPFICFPMISLEFQFANWDGLITFLFVSFFCLKSKILCFSFILMCEAPFGYQKCKAWGHDPLSFPLNTVSSFSTALQLFLIFQKCLLKIWLVFLNCKPLLWKSFF